MAKQLGRAQSPEAAPVGSVGGEGDAFGAIGKVFSGLSRCPAGEGGVIGLEELFCKVGRGDDYGGDEAEPQGHDGAVADG